MNETKHLEVCLACHLVENIEDLGYNILVFSKIHDAINTCMQFSCVAKHADGVHDMTKHIF